MQHSHVENEYHEDTFLNLPHLLLWIRCINQHLIELGQKITEHIVMSLSTLSHDTSQMPANDSYLLQQIKKVFKCSQMSNKFVTFCHKTSQTFCKR